MANLQETLATGARMSDAAPVRCLLIPLEGVQLLLPTTVVAEVTMGGEVTPVKGAPPWMLGILAWRGRRVPLVAFEKMLGAPISSEQRSGRMVVLNTLNGNPALPFVAMPVYGVPRLVQADTRNVTTGGARVGGLALRVDALGASAYIPDLDTVERLVTGVPLA